MSALPEPTAFLAWWGAILSTALAVVKIFELWRDRFRVEVSYSLVGDEEIGNTVFIRNLSGRPFILTYWELFYASRYLARWRAEAIQDREFDAGDYKVEPFSTLPLRFSEAKYFSWHENALRGRAIYIRLHLAGRRPIVRRVFQPD
jgi:hypothetical protein